MVYPVIDISSMDPTVDIQPFRFKNMPYFLFFLPLLLLGLLANTLFLGVIYYHFLVKNVFTGRKAVQRELTWLEALSGESKTKTFYKIVFGNQEALWVMYEVAKPFVYSK